MEGNPFEKSKQEHEAVEAKAVPENSAYYAEDNRGNIVFGASEQDLNQKILDANQGYN